MRISSCVRVHHVSPSEEFYASLLQGLQAGDYAFGITETCGPQTIMTRLQMWPGYFQLKDRTGETLSRLQIA